MTDEIRVHAHVLATTDQLLRACTTAIDLGHEFTLAPEVAQQLDLSLAARHVLSMRALLDRVGDREVEPYVRCFLAAKITDDEDPLEVDHLDIRLRDYVALTPADYDTTNTRELVRQLPVDALAPDCLTPGAIA